MEIFNYEVSDELSDGTWVTIETPGGDFKIKIANVAKNEYQSKIDKERKNYFSKNKKIGRKVSNEDWIEEGLTAMLPNFIANNILLDWEGLTKDGKPIPFNKELAEKFCSKKFPTISKQIFDAVGDIENFFVKNLEEAVDEAKNI